MEVRNISQGDSLAARSERCEQRSRSAGLKSSKRLLNMRASTAAQRNTVPPLSAEVSKLENLCYT